MITRSYRFAGIDIAVSMPEELFYENEDSLSVFRVESESPDWTFVFERVAELSAPEGRLVSGTGNLWYSAADDRKICYLDAYQENWENASVRIEYRGNTGYVQLREAKFPSKVPIRYVLKSLAVEHLTAKNNGFILHCSYIDHNGKAILFTAPSGTGKSTQADLWQRYRNAEIINGDRAVVRIADGVLMACGLPFSGTSEYCKNKTLPIEAIIYLGQAPAISIRKLRGYEAFSKIWEGVSFNTWNKTDVEQISAAVQKAAGEIPVLHMLCTPDEAAVTALEKELRKLVEYA